MTFDAAWIYLVFIPNFVSTTFPALPAAPETQPVNFSVPREQFTITWNEPTLYMNDTVDAYFVNISGPNDLCGNGNMVQMVTERSFTCFIQTIPQEGDVYTFTVRARTTNCDGNLRGSESEAFRLQGMYISSNVFFSTDIYVSNR